MRRSSLAKAPCPIARSLDAVGEWWSLLIIRDAFMGSTRFSEFERSLGLSKNILASRLRKLVEAGIFERIARTSGRGPDEYRLTSMGQELWVTLAALRQWGDKWLFAPGEAPLRMIDRRSGADVAPIQVRSINDVLLTQDDVTLVANVTAASESG